MRRVLLVLLLSVAALLAAYSVYWFSVAAQLRAGVAPWAEARRAEGYRVAWSHFDVDGFPWRFRLRFADWSFGGARPLPFDLAGAQLSGTAHPWDLSEWHLRADEGARAAFPDGAASAAARAADGHLSLRRGAIAAITLTAQDISGENAVDRLHVATAQAALSLPAAPPASHRDPSISATLRLDDIRLPRAIEPFGGIIDRISLAGTVRGAVPRGKLREALAAWRDDGGTVELSDASLSWGTLALTAAGTLALDQALQPEGALTATVEGQNAVIDAVAANGNLRPGDASLLKTFLGLMAKTGSDGKKQLTLPLSLQNDRVYLGPAQVLALPRITWE